MPVRKLTRGDAGEPCGGAEMISGGTPDPVEPGEDEDRQAEGGERIDAMVGALLSGVSAAGEAGGPQGRGQDQGQGAETKGQREDQGQGAQARSGGGKSPSVRYQPSRLQQAASEVITQLHAAKQELAKELEANLKQLKAVLQETQRIAKDMEAVLKEAKAEPDAEEQATGDDGGGKSKAKQKQAAWKPPALKQQAGKQKKGPDTPQWDVPDDSGDEDDDPVPSWEPPQDALQGHHQQQH